MKKRGVSLYQKKQAVHARRIIRRLKKIFPNAGMMLRYHTNFELLVAVILSAQCTDKTVNIVTPALFRRYRTLSAYANADRQELERYVFSTGFYRNKAKNIIAAAQRVQNTYHGEVPNTMKEILTLPGVARKTANVVLGNAYGVVEGIAVDTHVKRLVGVLGLSKARSAEKIERELMTLVPRADWFLLTYLLIEYGRTYCPARKHDIKECPLGHLEGSKKRK